MNGYFKKQIEALRQRHEALLQRPNEMQEETNGVIHRYVYPVLTRQHIPLEWRYDFNPATNPCCMERIGFNATMNSGALKWQRTTSGLLPPHAPPSDTFRSISGHHCSW